MIYFNWVRGYRLWCLITLSTLVQIYLGGESYWGMKPDYPEKTTLVQIYRGGQSYWGMKPEYPEKTTDKIYHIMLYRLLIGDYNRNLYFKTAHSRVLFPV